jgi:hypothetical protein
LGQKLISAKIVVIVEKIDIKSCKLQAKSCKALSAKRHTPPGRLSLAAFSLELAAI